MSKCSSLINISFPLYRELEDARASSGNTMMLFRPEARAITKTEMLVLKKIIMMMQYSTNVK